ncbi:MAG: GldG family protein [bacterium]|nr:GldG family protein [bacterium]
MNIRKLQYGTNFLALILIFLGFIIAINYISTKLFMRFDLTENKEFTISKSTKNILKNLDDIVSINLYFSKKLPPYLGNLKLKVDDLLKEYQVYSKGKISVNYFDPSTDPKLAQSMHFMGIPQVQFNIVEKDKAQVINVYLGMAILYEDKKEVIPVIQDTNNLEYDLTTKIIKVTSSEIKTIGFLTGHEEQSIYKDYEEVRELLKKQYEVTEIKIDNEKAEIDASIDTLVIPGPKKEISDEEAIKIDQFIMKGKKVVFLIDSIKMTEGSLNATVNKHGLDNLLKGYGLKINKNLVLDRSNASASFSSGFVYFTLPYPFWVRVLKENFALEHPAVGKLNTMILPWTGSVELLPSIDKDIKSIELIKTTKHSWTQEGCFNLNPQQSFTSSTASQNTLAIVLSGKFKSAFSKERENLIKESLEESQIVLLGNSIFIANNFIQQFESNSIFFLNLIDWLNLGDKLIDIRSRAAADRHLREISEYEKTFLKFVVMFLMPLIVVIYGVIRFYLKNKTKKLIEIYKI